MFSRGSPHILICVTVALIASQTAAEFAFTSYPTSAFVGRTYTISWRGDNGTVRWSFAGTAPETHICVDRSVSREQRP